MLLTNGYTLGLPKSLLWVQLIYLSNSQNPGKYLNQLLVKSITKNTYAGYSEEAWGRSVECSALPLSVPTSKNPHVPNYLKALNMCCGFLWKLYCVVWLLVDLVWESTGCLSKAVCLVAGKPGAGIHWSVFLSILLGLSVHVSCVILPSRLCAEPSGMTRVLRFKELLLDKIRSMFYCLLYYRKVG